jgi:hypothetical protein
MRSEVAIDPQCASLFPVKVSGCGDPILTVLMSHRTLALPRLLVLNKSRDHENPILFPATIQLVNIPFSKS